MLPAETCRAFVSDLAACSSAACAVVVVHATDVQLTGCAAMSDLAAVEVGPGLATVEVVPVQSREFGHSSAHVALYCLLLYFQLDYLDNFSKHAEICFGCYH